VEWMDAASTKTHGTRLVAIAAELARAGTETNVYTFSERAGCSSTARAAWPLSSLRTDSVNRGFCISRFTLEMIFFAISSRFLFFIFFILRT